MKKRDIFYVFFKIGLILLGGGYVIVPVMKKELVEKRKWLTEDELLDFYCVAGSLPGIIAINTAILTGYKLNKLKGALTSVFAMSLSPFLAIVIIASLMDKIMKIPYIEGLFWGVNLSVIVLIYLTIKEMWSKSIVDTMSLFWFCLVLVLSLKGATPVSIVVSSVMFGLILEFAKEIRENDS